MLDSDEKTVIRTKLKLGEKFLYLNEDSLNVLDKDSKWVLKFKKREKLLIRKNIFCDSSINIKDVNYLILEYDNYVHFTFLGIISRGLFDRSNSFNNISAQLNSGRIIKLFHFNFSDTIYSESINPLAFEDDFEQDFDAFPLGKTAVELISKILQKPYMIINYKSPD